MKDILFRDSDVSFNHADSHAGVRRRARIKSRRKIPHSGNFVLVVIALGKRSLGSDPPPSDGEALLPLRRSELTLMSLEFRRVKDVPSLCRECRQRYRGNWRNSIIAYPVVPPDVRIYRAQVQEGVRRRTLIEHRESNFRAGTKRKQHALARAQARASIDFDPGGPYGEP